MNITKELFIKKLEFYLLNMSAKRFLLALDGRCASGKTSFANELSEIFNASVFHIDNFYLPFDKRKEDWKKTPLGNIDIERFVKEILFPLKEGKDIIDYSIYDCKTDRMIKTTQRVTGSLVILEGSYVLYPEFLEFYDATLFITVDRDTQIERLKKRESGLSFLKFLQLWIPLEEMYFKEYGIENIADYTISTVKIDME